MVGPLSQTQANIEVVFFRLKPFVYDGALELNIVGNRVLVHVILVVYLARP